MTPPGKEQVASDWQAYWKAKRAAGESSKPLSARQWGKLQEERLRKRKRQPEPDMPSQEAQAADPIEAQRARLLQTAWDAVAELQARRAAPEVQAGRPEPPPGCEYIGRLLDDPAAQRLQQHIRQQLEGFPPLSRTVLGMLAEFIAQFERIVPNVSARPGGEAFSEWRALLDEFRFLQTALFEPLLECSGKTAEEAGASLAGLGCRGGRGPKVSDEELIHHAMVAMAEGWPSKRRRGAEADTKPADATKIEAFRRLGITASSEAEAEAVLQRFKRVRWPTQRMPTQEELAARKAGRRRKPKAGNP